MVLESAKKKCHTCQHVPHTCDRIYFDSYGQITPVEIQRYLKINSEFDHRKEVIPRNTDIVQAGVIFAYSY